MKKLLNILALLCVFAGTKVVADDVVADQEEVVEQVEQTEAVVAAEEVNLNAWVQACQDHPYITGSAVGGSSLLVASLIYALKYYLWKQAEVEAELEKKRDEAAAEMQEHADAGDAPEGDMPPFYQPCLDHPLLIGGSAAGVTALIAAIVYLLKQYLAEQIEDGVEQEAVEGEAVEERRARVKKDSETLKRALGVQDNQKCPFLGLCTELMGEFGDACPYLKKHPKALEKNEAKKCPFLAACKK